jgi:hypothetical protein
MGFRNYDPGLNRYLTRDTYNGALDDMSLASTRGPETGTRSREAIPSRSWR